MCLTLLVRGVNFPWFIRGELNVSEVGKYLQEIVRESCSLLRSLNGRGKEYLGLELLDGNSQPNSIDEASTSIGLS